MADGKYFTTTKKGASCTQAVGAASGRAGARQPGKREKLAGTRIAASGARGAPLPRAQLARVCTGACVGRSHMQRKRVVGQRGERQKERRRGCRRSFFPVPPLPPPTRHTPPARTRQHKNTHSHTPHPSTTGEIHELREDLRSLDRARAKDAVKRVIAAMTVGKDVAALFPDVANLMQTGE